MWTGTGFKRSITDICQIKYDILYHVPNEIFIIYFLMLSIFIAIMKEGLDRGVSNSLISKNLAHYSLSLKFLLIL